MTALPSTTEVVVAPPQPGPGAWAGAPSAVHVDGTTYLAYRLRRPVGEGRGFCNVVAAVTDAGLSTPAVVGRDRFGADSLERPALVRTPEGRWRLYVSCATPGTTHWRVDLLEADTPQELATAPAVTVLPGSASSGVEDPVVLLDRGRWHLWASAGGAAHRPRPRPLARPRQRPRPGAARRAGPLRHRVRQHRPPRSLTAPSSRCAAG